MPRPVACTSYGPLLDTTDGGVRSATVGSRLRLLTCATANRLGWECSPGYRFALKWRPQPTAFGRRVLGGKAEVVASKTLA